jgi:hypothetical protein
MVHAQYEERALLLTPPDIFLGLVVNSDQPWNGHEPTILMTGAFESEVSR